MMKLKSLIKEAPSPKYWVFPDGNMESLGGLEHHRWLKANLPVAKKYGLDTKFIQSSDSEQDIRLRALAKGFFRVAFNSNGDTVIEGDKKLLTPQKKKTIFNWVNRNKNWINNLTVTLFKGPKPDVTKTINLFTHEGDIDVPFMSQ